VASDRGDALQQLLVTEYEPGAPIGWHRDRPIFGDVVDVSLLASCTFRLRRKLGGRAWARASLAARAAFRLHPERPRAGGLGAQHSAGRPAPLFADVPDVPATSAAVSKASSPPRAPRFRDRQGRCGGQTPGVRRAGAEAGSFTAPSRGVAPHTP
jgi:hypothetical protein